jgi:hypothetical protein
MDGAASGREANRSPGVTAFTFTTLGSNLNASITRLTGVSELNWTAKRRFSPTFKTPSAGTKLIRATLEDPDLTLRDVSSAFGKLVIATF